MRENLTEIVVILDKSGSMDSLGTEPVDGFNNLIAEQSNPELGDANVTLVLFSDKIQKVYDGVDIKSVKPLVFKKHNPFEFGATFKDTLDSSKNNEYSPYGMTALYDAIGTAFTDVGARLAAMKEEDRPSKVYVCIITDGLENSSKIFRKARIAEMIKEQQEKYSWEIDFKGSDPLSIQDEAICYARDFKLYDNTKEAFRSMYSDSSIKLNSLRVRN